MRIIVIKSYFFLLPVTEDFFTKYNWDSKTILIVEDDVSSVFFLKEILKDTGVDLLIAGDGQKALDVCKDCSQLDLVLMDIQLPVLNGYESTRIIKTRCPKLPVIAQTAYAMTEEKNKCIEAGCIDYISKPINPLVLLDMISRYI